MAYTGINKSTANFNTKLYTGNGGTNAQTGVGFKPDFTWIKQRVSSGYNHALFDVVRGATKVLQSNLTVAERTLSDSLTAFGSDGFTLGADGDGTYGNTVNQNTKSYCSWNWKAGTTSGIATNGSTTITPSAYSFNQDAGFSIIKYTGNSTSGAKIAHGLGVAPDVMIVKATTVTDDGWYVYNKAYDASNNKYQRMEVAGGLGAGSAFWNSTAPTTSTISLGNSTGTNSNGQTYIAYIFADKTGFSKMGSYIGNGSTDGIFCFTGFKPTFVMFKATATNESWQIYDVKRTPNNALGEYLNPNNNSNAGNNANFVDYLSNGFKLRSADGGVNSGQLYTYMAFGQSLVGSNNVPCTAR